LDEGNNDHDVETEMMKKIQLLMYNTPRSPHTVFTCEKKENNHQKAIPRMDASCFNYKKVTCLIKNAQRCTIEYENELKLNHFPYRHVNAV